MFFNSNDKEQDQYFQTIRNLVVVFGSLFNKMILVRKNNKTGAIEEKVQVPIHYANKQKMMSRVVQSPDTEEKNINVLLPRLGFSFNGLSYDSSRMLPKTGGRGRPTKDQQNKKDALLQYNAAPYNFDFELSILCKYQEDLTQLIEKILPYFTPEFTITYKAIPEMGIEIDVPITLNSISINDDYEGDFESRRVLSADLSFVAKGYIFPPIKDFPVINEVMIETQIVNDHVLKNKDKKHFLKQENKEFIDLENGGKMESEESANSLTNNVNEAVLLKYGYKENDEFGFESYIYELENYQPEDREEIQKKSL